MAVLVERQVLEQEGMFDMMGNNIAASNLFSNFKFLLSIPNCFFQYLTSDFDLLVSSSIYFLCLRLLSDLSLLKLREMLLPQVLVVQLQGVDLF